MDLKLLAVAMISLAFIIPSTGSPNNNAPVRVKRMKPGNPPTSAGGNSGSPSTSKAKSKAKAKKPSATFRTSKANLVAAMKADLISKTVSRFEGKHLFHNGKLRDINGNPVNSFTALTSNPQFAKQYMLDLNKKLYQGGILPQVGPDKVVNGVTQKGQFNKWLDKMDTHAVSIIDADVGALKADLKHQFDAYKASMTSQGKVDAAGNIVLVKGDKIPNFMTDNVYTVTHVTFHPDAVDPATGQVTKVSVKAEQIQTRVELGTDLFGKPSHFERLDPTGPQHVVKSSTVIASFSTNELKVNADVTQEFWKKLGVGANTKNVLLNEHHAIYDVFKKSADGDFDAKTQPRTSTAGTRSSTPGTCSGAGPGKRRKRAARTGCALMLKPNGEVDSIFPKEFVEVYKKADWKGKQEMAEMAKDHTDKIVTDVRGGDGDAKNVKKLVQLEEMKSYVASIDTVQEIQSIKSSGNIGNPGDSDLSKMMNDVTDKISQIKSKVKLSTAKVSKGISSWASSKSAKGFSKGVAQVSNPLSKFFLAKTVINGIVQGDTTSLAIVGTRVGYEVVTGTTVWAGAKYFSAASKVGKFAKYLGKVAGPVGAIADIGLSVWSLTKSVDRLKHAKNKYERDDAIADIVGDSIDIVVTATVTVLSMAFPPAAPLIIAVGAVVDLLTKLATSIFKAANEVARINSEIPLLGHEKSYVFTSRAFDWFGTRRPDYIESMLKEKQANDLAVQHNLKFLEQNDAFLGIVFPSKTLHYDGACSLTKRHCPFWFIFDCWSWEDTETVGSGCDWRRPCGSWGICDNYWKKVNNKGGYDDFQCKCDGTSNTNFSLPRSDSVVDFRSKKYVYWERAVPKEVKNAEFKCKPGTLEYLDYKVSQEDSRWEFYCEHAIGLLQPAWRRKQGQTMLFDLDDGSDIVHASFDSTPNIFRMGNSGYKEFHGGWGRNEFVFDSNCNRALSGSIYGGSTASDVISFGERCGNGRRIEVDFINGVITDSKGNLRMSMSSIEEVNGRQGQGETVLVSCSTKKVHLAGGSSNNKDEVNIKSDYYCSYNLTVFAGANTKITSEARKGTLYIPVSHYWGDISITLMLYKALKLNLIFAQTASREITGLTWNRNGNKKELTLWSTKGQIKFTFDMAHGVNDVSLYFTEEPEGVPYSVLYLTKEGSPICYHSLPNIQQSSVRRIGCRYMENMFDITGNNGWLVMGGEKSDEFVIHTSHVTEIDGGSGDDTLKLHQNFDESFEVDLNSKFKSIENVIGVPGVPLSVWCACTTKVVSPQGGSQNAPDVIFVTGSCSQRNVQVVAQGHSRVVVENGAGSTSGDIINIIAVKGHSNSPVRFELETKNQVKGVMMAVVTSHKQLKVAECRRRGQFVNVLIQGTSGERVKLNVKEVVGSREAYLEMPYIQLSLDDTKDPAGQLIIERESLAPRVLFDLDEEESSTLKGYQEIPNMFRFSDAKVWTISGGDLNDIFTLSTESNSPKIISIDGGDGEDTLYVDKASSLSHTTPIVINLAKGEFGKSGKITSIEHVVGRTSAPDIIHTTCTTKTVNGRGGLGPGSGKDLIIIPELNCRLELNVALVVGKHTNVRSQAMKGHFVYNVDELFTSSVELRPTKSNFHQLKFQFHPWDVIKGVAWDSKTDSMGWKISTGQGQEGHVQAFQLAQRDDRSEEFDNPVFVFQPEGSKITSDIRVRLNGVTMATFMVRGTDEYVKGIPVDVNRFLINVTESQVNSKWSISGCSDSKRCSANQFWIFKLASALPLLDGGDCVKASEEFGGCTNHLHLTSKFHGNDEVRVDLSPKWGSITSSKGTKLIANLRNIHELHGSRGVSAYVTCATAAVSRVDKVTIKGEARPLNLVIGLEEWTQVVFEESEFPNNMTLEERVEMFDASTVHYRFARPMSFDPQGSLYEMLMHSHNYYLPFTLDNLESVNFDLENDKFFYKLNGKTFQHTMLSSTGYNEEFYSQPAMVTQDGFKLEIARDGSLWATLGKTLDISPNKIPVLQDTANRLKITMILQTSNDFFFVGYAGKDEDRTVLQNIAARNSHLCGGGGANAIYEILHLDKDVYIYSGFKESTFTNWVYTRSGAKQTIDLTDVVVPIRLQSGTKYVPKLEKVRNNLVITMAGYKNENPGKLVIVNGAHEWVSKRLQLLLNHAIMDLHPVSSPGRRKRDSNPGRVKRGISHWVIKPRPVMIPIDVSIYSISPEDLEDGQEIRLESALDFRRQSNELKLTSLETFKAVRNAGDLYFTSMGNLEGVDDSQATTVIISDFYELPGELRSDSLWGEDQQNRNFPRGIRGVAVSLPGLSLMLNDSNVAKYTVETGKPTQMRPLTVVPPIESVLYEVEEPLLKDLPGIHGMFACADCREDYVPWYKHVLEAKEANDLAVQHNLKLLEGYL